MPTPPPAAEGVLLTLWLIHLPTSRRNWRSSAGGRTAFDWGPVAATSGVNHLSLYPLAGHYAGITKTLLLSRTGGSQLGGRSGGEKCREAPVWRALCCLNMLLLSSLGSCSRGDFNFGLLQSVIRCLLIGVVASRFGETVLFSSDAKRWPWGKKKVRESWSE